MKRDIWIPFMTIIILVIGFALSPVNGRAYTNTQRLIFPTDFGTTSCSGELVQLSGSFMALFHVTVSDTGRQSDLIHYNFLGVKAIGVDSGEKYQVHGETNDHIFYVTPGSAFTDISIFHLLGHGAGNDLRVYYTIHYTVNSDGQVTANVDKVRSECK